MIESDEVWGGVKLKPLQSGIQAQILEVKKGECTVHFVVNNLEAFVYPHARSSENPSGSGTKSNVSHCSC